MRIDRSTIWQWAAAAVILIGLTGLTIRAAYERLRGKKGDEHEALHGMLDCLAETVWQAQRNGTTPDGAFFAGFYGANNFCNSSVLRREPATGVWGQVTDLYYGECSVDSIAEP